MRIAQSGHSRIPVYEDDVKNIIGLLFVKDLIFHDADSTTGTILHVINKYSKTGFTLFLTYLIQHLRTYLEFW